MTLLHAILLFTSAVLGGAMNAVAGGGSFVTFPTLVWLGLPAVDANATNTVALWPGTLGSSWGFRGGFQTLFDGFHDLLEGFLGE